MAGMIVLENDWLSVSVAEPGEVYRRTRFDWTGICTQIRSAGGLTYLSQEAAPGAPGTEGVGLTWEFGLMRPVGYEAAEPGTSFPKLGVGLLERDTPEPYNFMRDYPCRPAHSTVEKVSGQEAIFRQDTEPGGEYAWSLRRRLFLQDDSLTQETLLENRGRQPLHTDEYGHNFLRIGDYPVGPDYELQLPFDVSLSHEVGRFEVSGGRIRVPNVGDECFYALHDRPPVSERTAWRLLHVPSGHGVEGSELFRPARFALWGMRHVISPEFFIELWLQPGERRTWSRRYRFF